eukprot:TRINITY_DN263_c0_g1_i1.p1 TRINITY_DN263_c0_g1~~TRINITY_DN263_c0_g1_i1.p1  ORF type:complete len:332 (-),score=68.17 TRINITY_DN263_c0_g1_i1:469-1464(-)
MKTVTAITLVLLWAAVVHATLYDHLLDIPFEFEVSDLTVQSLDRPASITRASNRIRSSCSPKVLVYGFNHPALHETVVAHLTSSGVIEASDVSLLGMSTGPLTSEHLVGIDIAILWNGGNGLQADAVGDVLADFVDGGGAVVVMSLLASVVPYAPAGRFVSDNYMPFQPLGLPLQNNQPSWTFAAALDVPDLNHPLLTGVVQGGQALYNPGQVSVAVVTDSQLAPGATLVASYVDVGPNHHANVPAIAVKTIPGKKPVVALQFWPIDDFDYSAFAAGVHPGLSVDVAAQERLLVNAVLYSWTNCQTEQPCACNNAIKPRLCSLPEFAHLCA